MCVFVFVDKCCTLPVLGQFVLCILVVSIHLNDSLFDFFHVTQLTVINFVLSKYYNGMWVSFFSHTYTTLYHESCLPRLLTIVNVNGQCTHIQIFPVFLSYKYHYHGHWLLPLGMHGANISAIQWTCKEYFKGLTFHGKREVQSRTFVLQSGKVGTKVTIVICDINTVIGLTF